MPKLPNENTPQQSSSSRSKLVKVVILGGGYGGAAAGRVFLNQRHVQTTLIDRNNFQVYKSSLYEAANEEISRETVTISLKEIFANSGVKPVRGDVSKIDRSQKQVYLSDGTNYSYDYLVLALGAVSNDFGIPGVYEHSFMFRELREVILMRDNIRTIFHMASERGKREISLTICGGGFSGVELAAELRNHLPLLQKEYRIPKVNIMVLEASSQILSGMPEKVIDLTKSKLTALKIDFKLGDPVVEVKSDGVRLNSGQWIPSDLVVWTAGTKPNPLIEAMGLPLDQKGRPVVNDNLAIIGQPDIYVIGDLAGYINPKTGLPIPQQAYHAISMGKLAGQNILNTVKKLPPRPFKPSDNHFIMPFGHKDAIAYYRGRVFSGFFPWTVVKLYEFQYLSTLFGVIKSWPIFWTEVEVALE